MEKKLKEMEKKFGYVIKVDGETVWHGPNPKERYWEIKKQNPDKEVAIAWRAQSKNIVIYPPRRAQRTQSFRTVSIVADFPDGSAFSVCSAVKFEDISISLENSTVPRGEQRKRF